MLSIPGYEVLRVLGQGGMATVYLARDLRLRRLVAIKVMSSFCAADPDFCERFRKEAQTVAGLNHTNIVTVYAVGTTPEQLPYIVMEYLPNGDARSRIRDGMSPADAVAFLNIMAEALRYAHQNQCVHRDIKPDNILFRDNGSPAIADFGVVKTLTDDSSMTVVGSVIGTPKYMSPEQAQGMPVTGKSDFYSLGVVFHEMLTGHAPYVGSSSVSVLVNHVSSPVPPLPGALSAFQPLLDGLMAKTAQDRLSDVSRIRELSHRCLSAYRKRSSRQRPLGLTGQEQQAAGISDSERTEIWTMPVHPHLRPLPVQKKIVRPRRWSAASMARAMVFSPAIFTAWLVFSGHTTSVAEEVAADRVIPSVQQAPGMQATGNQATHTSVTESEPSRILAEIRHLSPGNSPDRFQRCETIGGQSGDS